MKTKPAIVLVLCAIFSFFTMCTASANSAPTWWSGVDASGTMSFDTHCPITVENELLTLNIPDFPKSGGKNDGYNANVTAQYTFYNPTNNTITARLAFPFGKAPHYNSGGGVNKYGITVNGSAVKKTVRHTLSGNKFDLEKDLPLIVDEYKSDYFYRPDLPVTKYTVEILDYDESYKNASIGFDFSSFESNRVIMSYNRDLPIAYGHRLGVYIGSQKYITFYILGKKVQPKYNFYENGTCKTGEEISGEAKIVSTEEMTFEELVFEAYDEDSAVLKVDWYNAVIDNIKHNSGTFKTSEFNVNDMFMRWYEYEITLAPGERIVNTVTAPLYPDIDENYKPEKYMYTYLLSPAKRWADFGTLDIVINTPFYMLNNTEFEKTDFGYELSLDGLPNKELEFTLISKENSKENPRESVSIWDLFYVIPICIFAVLVIALIVGIVKARRKKHM